MAVETEAMASVVPVVGSREVEVMAREGMQVSSGEEVAARAEVAAAVEAEVDKAEEAEGVTEVEAEQSVVGPSAVAAMEVVASEEAALVVMAMEVATWEEAELEKARADGVEASAVASALQYHRRSTERRAVHSSCRSVPRRICLPIGQARRLPHRTPPMTTQMPRPARSQFRARCEARPTRRGARRTLRNGSTPRPTWRT